MQTFVSIFHDCAIFQSVLEKARLCICFQCIIFLKQLISLNEHITLKDLILIFYDPLALFNTVVKLIVNNCNSINSILTFKPFEFLCKLLLQYIQARHIYYIEIIIVIVQICGLKYIFHLSGYMYICSFHYINY